jgi:hypothetical protein
MTNENDSLNTLIKAIPMGDYVGDVLAAGINLRHAITPPPQASQPVTASMEALLRKLLEIARDVRKLLEIARDGLATVSEMGRENADPIVKLLTDKADETNAKLWENGLGQLQATPAATEGERVCVGMKVKACHPSTYRPDGFEFATVESIWIDENKRIQVGVRYSNNVTDFSPEADFWVYYQPTETEVTG